MVENTATGLGWAIFDAVVGWLWKVGARSYVLVENIDQEGVKVPNNYVVDGKIALNITPEAVRDFASSEWGIHFWARFNGKEERIELPWGSFLVYSPDIDMPGIRTTPEEYAFTTPSIRKPAETVKEASKPKPTLKLVN